MVIETCPQDVLHFQQQTLSDRHTNHVPCQDAHLSQHISHAGALRACFVCVRIPPSRVMGRRYVKTSCPIGTSYQWLEPARLRQLSHDVPHSHERAGAIACLFAMVSLVASVCISSRVCVDHTWPNEAVVDEATEAREQNSARPRAHYEPVTAH